MIKYDDSFDYSTVWGTVTHHSSHIATECCDDSASDGIWAMCQCGNEVSIHPDTDLNWLQCYACKRVGKWETDY